MLNHFPYFLLNTVCFIPTITVTWHSSFPSTSKVPNQPGLIFTWLRCPPRGVSKAKQSNGKERMCCNPCGARTGFKRHCTAIGALATVAR